MPDEQTWHEFDPVASSAMDAQLMLSQLVVPRPIAMISTRSPAGVLNVAPFSYFMPVTGRPSLVAVTMGLREDARLKDSYENARASGDFVINVTSEQFRMDIETVAKEFPADVDEFREVGWTSRPSVRVSAPAVAEASACLECRVHSVVDFGEPGVPFSEVHVVFAEVVYIAYRDAILNERGRIDPVRLGPIGRLGLRSFVRTVPEGVYELERIPWRAST